MLPSPLCSGKEETPATPPKGTFSPSKLIVKGTTEKVEITSSLSLTATMNCS